MQYYILSFHIFLHFIRHNRQDLADAETRIKELECQLKTKEDDILNFQKDAIRKMDDMSHLRSELEKCYETHKHLHCDNEKLKELKHKMNIEMDRLKNELETLKTMHEQVKKANDLLRNEIKAIHCDEPPHNIKRLQEILATSREDMDKQRDRIKTLGHQLEEARQQIVQFRDALDKANAKSHTQDRYDTELFKPPTIPLLNSNYDEIDYDMLCDFDGIPAPSIGIPL